MNNCYTTEKNELKFCENCGSGLIAGQVYCTKCGIKIKRSENDSQCEIPVANTPGAYVVGEARAFMTKRETSYSGVRFGILGIVSGFFVAIAIAILLWNSNVGKNEFERKFPDIVYNSWCKVSDDGKTMTISGVAVEFTDKGLKAVFEVCNELGFNDAVQILNNDGGDIFCENEKYSFSGDFEDKTYDEVEYEAVFKIK